MLRALISMFIRSVFGFCEIFEFRTPFIRDERVIHDDLESFQCHSDSINCNLCDINKLPSFVKMIGYERPCIPSKSTRNGTVPYIHNLAVHIPTVVVPSYLLSVFGSFALSTPMAINLPTVQYYCSLLRPTKQNFSPSQPSEDPCDRRKVQYFGRRHFIFPIPRIE